jgi:hypothetical protein
MSPTLQILMILIVFLLGYIARLKGREFVFLVALVIIGSMLDDVDGIGPMINAVTGFILDLPGMLVDVITSMKAAG